MEKIKGYQILILVILIFSSCSTYRLSKEDNLWQPYKKRDILIFENSNKVFDTIYVSSNTGSKKTIEPYRILNKRKNSNISFGNNGKLNIKEMGLVRITKNKKDVFLGLSEYTFFTRFGIDISISEISKLEYIDKFYGKCYLIKDLNKYNYSKNSKIKSIVYSKNFGYIKFNLKNNNFIELKEFIRNGVNILK